MFAEVLENDTVGSLCQRHGLSRDEFFSLNDRPFFLIGEVKTAELFPGEWVRVASGEPVLSVPRETQEVEGGENLYFTDGENDYVLVAYQSDGSAASTIKEVGVVALGLILMFGTYYLIWRGIVSVAKGS